MEKSKVLRMANNHEATVKRSNGGKRFLDHNSRAAKNVEEAAAEERGVRGGGREEEEEEAGEEEADDDVCAERALIKTSNQL